MDTLHDNDAERHLLACLLTGHPIIADVADTLQPRDLYQPRHEAIYTACLTVHARGDRVDPVTLPVPARDKPYLVELPTDTVVPVQAMAYATKLADLAVRRRLVEACQQGQHIATACTDATQAAEDVRQAVDAAAAQVRTQDAGVAAGESLESLADWLEATPIGAETPWYDVNERTNGMLAGQLITVAARPGGGKSLALKDAAVHTAKVGKPVHIATLEMSRNEYMARVLSTEGKVDLGRMLRRQLTDGDWHKLGAAMDRVRDLPLYLDDRERQTMAQIRAAARQTQRRYGQPLGLIGIDYCQLVQPALTKGVPREQQVAQISRDAKLMAKEFGCPVLLLAQLNRQGASRSDPTPQVTDLRESGALEQDSDQVWLLHRPDMYGAEDRLGEVDLIVGKNRNGPAPVTIPLAFRGHYAHLASLA